MFDNSFHTCGILGFFKVEISSCTLIPLFRPGSVPSDSVSWDDCDWVFPDKLRVSLFPNRFPHYAWIAAQTAHSDFIGSRVYTCLRVTCHLHFWQNDWGLLLATAVTRGWNRCRIKSQQAKRRRFSHSCWDSNLQPFDRESGVLTNKLSQNCNVLTITILLIMLLLWLFAWRVVNSFLKPFQSLPVEPKTGHLRATIYLASHTNIIYTQPVCVQFFRVIFQ